MQSESEYRCCYCQGDIHPSDPVTYMGEFTSHRDPRTCCDLLRAEIQKSQDQIHVKNNELSRMVYESIDNLQQLCQALATCKEKGYTVSVARVHQAALEILKEQGIGGNEGAV